MACSDCGAHETLVHPPSGSDLVCHAYVSGCDCCHCYGQMTLLRFESGLTQMRRDRRERKRYRKERKARRARDARIAAMPKDDPKLTAYRGFTIANFMTTAEVRAALQSDMPPKRWRNEFANAVYTQMNTTPIQHRGRAGSYVDYFNTDDQYRPSRWILASDHSQLGDHPEDVIHASHL